jgi:FkbM family methyltransferase
MGPGPIGIALLQAAGGVLSARVAPHLYWDLRICLRAIGSGLRQLVIQPARRLLRGAPAGGPVTDQPADHDVVQAVGSVVSVDGIRLRIDASLAEGAIRKILAGEHTQDERRLVLPVLETDDIVMELGGGIGMLSIACAQKIGSERVFSYEANPTLRPLIEENYRLNGVQPTIQMCMLGPVAGETTFYIARSFRVSSVYRPELAWKTATVPVKPFNDEMVRIRPSFLIVDIEGGEYELFDYARFDTVRTIVIEMHPSVGGLRRSLALRRKLRRLGFAEQTHNGKHFLYQRPRPTLARTEMP